MTDAGYNIAVRGNKRDKRIDLPLPGCRVVRAPRRLNTMRLQSGIDEPESKIAQKKFDKPLRARLKDRVSALVHEPK